MDHQQHHRALERIYLAAPINDFFHPTIEVAEGQARITAPVQEAFFHIAGAAHGSVYFKMLDDAAYFAVASQERECFVVTTSFTTYLTRPISSGELHCEGRVVNSNRSQWIAEAVLRDGKGREIGRGNGVFVRSKKRLAELPSYAD